MKENTVKIFEQSFKDNWDRPCLTDYNTKETITYADFARDIAKIHLFYKEIGIQEGDHVAIIGKNNPTWVMRNTSLIIARQNCSSPAKATGKASTSRICAWCALLSRSTTARSTSKRKRKWWLMCWLRSKRSSLPLIPTASP